MQFLSLQKAIYPFPCNNGIYMEKILKQTVFIVFFAFSIITSLLFVFPGKTNINNMLLPIVIIIAAAVFVKFPVMQNIKIKNPGIALLFISALALVVRIIWVSLVQVIPESDFYTYHSLGQSIITGNITNSVFVSLFPHVYGFSKILSFMYSIFGAEIITAVYFNITINMGILFLIYYLGKNLADVNTGLIAAAIYAFWPSQIFYNAFVLTEPLYTFGVLLTFYLYFIILKHIKKKWYLVLSFLLLGTGLGFLKLIRPAASIVLLSILIHFMFTQNECIESLEQRNRYSLRSKRGLIAKLANFKKAAFKASILAVLVLAFLITSALSLNYIEKTIGIETTRNTSGFFLLVGSNIEAKGKYNNEDAELLKDMINKGVPADEIQKKLSELGRKRLLQADILSQVNHQLNKNKSLWGVDTDSIHFTQAAFSPTSHIDIEKHSLWLSGVANVYYYIFFFISLYSLFVLKNKIPSFYYVFYLYILGTVAAHMLAEVQSRYHYPVIPLFCLLAATVLTRKHIA